MKKDRMSRVARRKVEKKKRIVNWFRGLPIKLLKDIGYLLVGILYLIYLFLNKFDNLVSKLYKKLPRLAQVSIIYILIGGCVFGIVKPSKTIVKVEKIEVAVSQEQVEEQAEEVEETPLTDEEIKETANTNFSCSMSTLACQIYYSALNVGMTKDQAIMTLSISMAECGRNLDSSNAINNNNFGGLYDCTNNRFYSYSTQEEGINAFVNTVKKYIDRGQDTPAKIQVNYAPIDAENDPEGKNKNWLPNVLTIISDISTQIN